MGFDFVIHNNNSNSNSSNSNTTSSNNNNHQNNLSNSANNLQQHNTSNNHNNSPRNHHSSSHHSHSNSFSNTTSSSNIQSSSGSTLKSPTTPNYYNINNNNNSTCYNFNTNTNSNSPSPSLLSPNSNHTTFTPTTMSNGSGSQHRDHSLPRQSSITGGDVSSDGATTPSASEPKYILRAHLPNDQRTTVPIKYPGQTVHEALEKAMHRRQLDASFCHVYLGDDGGGGVGRKLSWDDPAIDLVGQEIHVVIDELANPMLQQTRISHTYRKLTVFAHHSCDCCNKSLFWGFKCQACGFRFHPKCSKLVPTLCKPTLPAPDMTASEKTYYQKILSTNREATYIRVSAQASPAPSSTHRSRSSVSDMSSLIHSTGSSTTSSIKRKGKPKNLNFGEGHMLGGGHHLIHSAGATMGALTSPPRGSSSGGNRLMGHSITPTHSAHHQSTGKSSKKSNHLEPPQPPGHGRERSTSEPNVNVNLVSLNNPASATYVQNLINAQNKVAAGELDSLSATAGASGHGSSGGKDSHHRTNSIHRPRARSADESSKKKVHHRSAAKEDWEIPFEEILLGPRIGAGSFGTVYQGHWHGQVALKKLKVANPSEAQLREFKNELAILQKTRHVNVILYMGCVREPDLYIVTQWCEGSSLYKHIHVFDTEFQPIQLCEIARQTAQGMDYLHSKSIIHRDLKSNNIFLHNDFTVKIGDFGMATVKTTTTTVSGASGGSGSTNGGASGGSTSGLSAGQSAAAPKNPTGSILWMAPEILRMNSHDVRDPYTLQSDVYAFGVVLYELGSGQLPWTGMGRDQIMYCVGRCRRELANELGPIKADMPAAFKTLTKECVSREVERRPLFPKIVSQLSRIISRIPKIERCRSEPFLQMHRSPTDDYIVATYCPSPKTPINSNTLAAAHINTASFPFHGTINI